MEVAISSPTRKDASRRNADSHFVAWQQRTTLVKQQMATESAANDAKTARLKALRLAKEEEDRIAAALAPPPAPKKKSTRAPGMG
jgi:hypothetical protein